MYTRVLQSTRQALAIQSASLLRHGHACRAREAGTLCEVEQQAPEGLPSLRERELAEDHELLGLIDACAPWTAPAQPELGMLQGSRGVGAAEG